MLPILEEFKGYRETPQFSKYKIVDYLPAFTEAIKLAKIDLATLENSTDEPTFQNTIEKLDSIGAELDRVSGIFFNLNHAHTSDEMQTIAQEVSPLLSNFSNDIYLSEKLFTKVSKVKTQVDDLQLTTEQTTLLEKSYRAFVKNGALLQGEKKKVFRDITTKLSKLSLQFSQNVLAETNAYSLEITDEADLSGLPDSAKSAAKELAQEKGVDGWVFNLQFPSYMPFMQFADNRNLREKMFRAFSSRCNQDNKANNNSVVKDIVNLRLEKAKLLGYNTFSEMVLEDRMAGSAKTVLDFLEDLFSYALPAAQKDKKEVEVFAKSLGFEEELQRWDWAYYSEKLKESRYELTDEMTRPYFKLSVVLDSVLQLATTLYGITFTKTEEIEKYHDDVTTYEVLDSDGNFVSTFYVDMHPRESKQGGAWMTSFKDQYVEGATDHRPAVSIVCNFTKPTKDTPALLSFGEVETLLHEFGHALHGMLSKCTYQSLSGTSVYRDFVELPSQIMENWATEPDWLSTVAKHYISDEPIPQDLIDKIVKSKNFQSGYQTLRQLSFGMIDMEWHSLNDKFTDSVLSFETEKMAKTELFPTVDGSLFSSAFSHIFGGGYAAGYYGYKWAEVLDADAFEEFKKNGIFNTVVAERFKSEILEKGGSEHPMKLYKNFKGSEPKVDSLLIRSGLK